MQNGKALLNQCYICNSLNFLLFNSNTFKILVYLGISKRAWTKGKLICSYLKSPRNLPNYSFMRSYFYFCKIGNFKFVLLHRSNGLAIHFLLFILLNSFFLTCYFSTLNSLPLPRFTGYICSIGFILVLQGNLLYYLLKIKLASCPI